METVFLHENGHVVGLGHSDITGAVREPVYAGVRRSLHPDDKEGAAYLDPEQTATVEGTVTDAITGAFISGATVTLEGTPFSAETDESGKYVIVGVPFPVTNDITASAADRESVTKRLTVDENPKTVNFAFNPTEEETAAVCVRPGTRTTASAHEPDKKN